MEPSVPGGPEERRQQYHDRLNGFSLTNSGNQSLADQVTACWSLCRATFPQPENQTDLDFAPVIWAIRSIETDVITFLATRLCTNTIEDLDSSSLQKLKFLASLFGLSCHLLFFLITPHHTAFLHKSTLQAPPTPRRSLCGPSRAAPKHIQCSSPTTTQSCATPTSLSSWRRAGCLYRVSISRVLACLR